VSTLYEHTSSAPHWLCAPPTHAEVVIVGGGFAGLHTALGLQARGLKSIAIVEQQHIGFGASGRNGGFVFAGFSLGERSLLQRLGPERARNWYQRTLTAVGDIRRLIQQHQIECDLVDAGVLWCNWFADDQLLKSRQSLLRDHYGSEWEWVDKIELRKRVHSERYSAALFEREALHLHPLKLAHGLARTACAQGAVISEHSEVHAVHRSGDEHVVHHRFGSTRCKHVVLACGGYLAGALAAQQKPLRRALMPIATYVVSTEALGPRMQDVLQTQAAVYDTRFAFDYYRAMQDTRLVWGGRIHVRDADPNQVRKLLYSDMLRVFPQLRGIQIEHAWSGLMSYARHEMPQLGRLQQNLWYAQAFGGHGLAPTRAIGDALAAAIAEGDTAYQELSNFGLESTFGALGLAAAQLQYWRLQGLDWWRERRERATIGRAA
jgi:gamma-glutamylputrescine oxidase